MEGKGSVSLRPWTMEDKEDLARLCNGVDRSYLRNSLPFPYTEKDAEWWIGMTLDRDGKDGVFRAVWMERSLEISRWSRERTFTAAARRSAICWTGASGPGGS